MNPIATPIVRMSNERLSRLGLLQEPAGYEDGPNLYEYLQSNTAVNLDPLGLKVYTHEESIKYFDERKGEMKDIVLAMNDSDRKAPRAVVAAVSAIYVEMRRDASFKNLGASTGPGQIKYDFAQWAIDYDRWKQFNMPGTRPDFKKKLTSDDVKYRDAVYKLIQDDPIRIASVAMMRFIEQWSKQGHDISTRPEILATLYNLGPEKSVPKADPQSGGAVISYADGTKGKFGDLAKQFYDSQYAQDLLRWLEQQQAAATTQPATRPASP